MVHCYVERVSDETRRESIGQLSHCRLCLISSQYLNVSERAADTTLSLPEIFYSGSPAHLLMHLEQGTCLEIFKLPPLPNDMVSSLCGNNARM